MTFAHALSISALFLSILWYYVISPPWFCSGLCCFNDKFCTQIFLEGTVEPGYEQVVHSLEKSLTVGWDLGASLYAAVDGETVIDVAGGFKDRQKKNVYKMSTLNVIFSSGKVIEAITIAMLVDKGLIALEAPVAQYWPEFGQKGKEDITIKDFLSHRSGSSTTFEVEPDVHALQNLEKRDQLLASQKFLYPRGTVAYRAWGSALYLDAVCRRVDPLKRTLAKFIQDELFHKLGEDFFCPSIDDTPRSRVSSLHDPSVPTLLLGMMPQVFIPGVYSKVLPNAHPLRLNSSLAPLFKAIILKQKHPNGFSYFDQPTIPDVDKGSASFNNHSSFLSYENMSGNSISNARAIGKALDAFMNGQVVRNETFSSIMAALPLAYDQILGFHFAYTAGGFAISPHAFITNEDAQCYGWFGIGGSVLQHCIVGNHKFTLSYVMNGMSPLLLPDRGVKLLDKMIAVLKKRQINT